MTVGKWYLNWIQKEETDIILQIKVEAYYVRQNDLCLIKKVNGQREMTINIYLKC